MSAVTRRTRTALYPIVWGGSTERTDDGFRLGS